MQIKTIRKKIYRYFSKPDCGSYQPFLKDRPSRDSRDFPLGGWSALDSGHPKQRLADLKLKVTTSNKAFTR